MIRTEIRIDEIETAMARVAEALTDMTPVMQDIGEFMVESTEQNFRDGQSPDGAAWAPRSQTTLDAYARRDPPFVPSGGPLIGESRSLSTTISYDAAQNSVEWGSNMIYAAVMQMGAAQGEFGARIGRDKNGRDFFMTIPWGDIPARPFLGVGDDDAQGITDILAEYLNGAVEL